jgi:hypothetical protein
LKPAKDTAFDAVVGSCVVEGQDPATAELLTRRARSTSNRFKSANWQPARRARGAFAHGFEEIA